MTLIKMKICGGGGGGGVFLPLIMKGFLGWVCCFKL